MSGKDLAQQFRDQEPVSKPPSGGGNLGFIVALIAVCALGFGAVAGYRLLMPGTSPAVVTLTKAELEAITWTDADTAKCESRARAAANEDIPDEIVMANPALTDGGFAALATRLECRATLKVARLCDGVEKAAFVAMVKDYVTRLDLVVAALNLQGAPMALLGGLMGGEAQAGSAMYEFEKEQTFAYLKIYHDRVGKALRALVAANLISASDFGIFMGIGVSDTVIKTLDDSTPTHSVCS